MLSEDRIDLHGEAGLPFVKNRPYTGSFKGMRYRLSKKTDPDDEKRAALLEAVIYPEPCCFEATPEEEKEYRDFPFTDEGFTEAVAWINEEFKRQRERWKNAVM